MTERSKISERTVIVVRKFAFLLLLVSLFAFAAAPAFADAASKEGWPEQLKFSAGPPGGNWFALGSTLSDMWSKNTISVTSSSGGGVSNIINCDRGRGDFGFTNTSILGAAIKGEQDFEGRATKNATILANLYTQYTFRNEQELRGEAPDKDLRRHHHEEDPDQDGDAEARHRLGIRL